MGNGASESATIRLSSPTHCAGRVWAHYSCSCYFTVVLFRCWSNQKAFHLPLSTYSSQFVNVTIHYHIVNSGLGDSKIFTTNVLVKLAVAYMMIWCFHPLGYVLETEKTQHYL